MRAHGGKTSVRVYDYADTRVPVLLAVQSGRVHERGFEPITE